MPSDEGGEFLDYFPQLRKQRLIVRTGGLVAGEFRPSRRRLLQLQSRLTLFVCLLRIQRLQDAAQLRQHALSIRVRAADGCRACCLRLLRASKLCDDLSAAADSLIRARLYFRL